MGESFRFPALALGRDALRSGGALSSGLAPPGPDRGWPRSWQRQEVAQKSRQVVEKIVARKLVRRPVRPAGGRGACPATHQPKAVIECNSAPSSQAFVVAESGQTTVELWRRVFNDHAFPCATLASDRPMPPVVPSAGKVLIAWHKTLKNIVELL
jgi:hypothetical protein